MASLVSEVCSNVAVEPHLQTLNGEEFDGASATTGDGARLGIAAGGIWGVLMKEPFLMFAFSILMYIQIVIVVVLLQYIGNMRQKREEFMNKESWRLNMWPLFP